MAGTSVSTLLLLGGWLFVLAAGTFGSVVEEEARGIEFPFFHRDSDDSPWKREWSSHEEKMHQLLKEGRDYVAFIDSSIKSNFSSTQGSGEFSHIERSTLSVSVDGSSQLYTLGAYVINAPIGTPAKTQSLLFSTSSDFSWVQCSTCKKCFKQLNSPYSTKKSKSSAAKKCKSSSDCTIPGLQTTCKSKSCTFSGSFDGQKQIKGNLVTDTFQFRTFGKKTKSSIKGIQFGCVTSQSGYKSYADGVAGFGNSDYSFPSQAAKVLGKKAFATCMLPYYLKGKSKLIMGSSAIPKARISYAPSPKPPSNSRYYYVDLVGIKVGGKTVNIPSSAFKLSSAGLGGTILDVGTTFIYLVPSALNPVHSALKQQASKKLKLAKNIGGYSLCFSLKIKSMPTLDKYFPELTFVFGGGAQVSLKGSYYMDKTSTSTVCSTLQSTGNFNLLGTLFHQNVLVVYDIAKSRIGLKSTSCSKYRT